MCKLIVQEEFCTLYIPLFGGKFYKIQAKPHMN